jgi:exodeoxyribonuclease VII large subunit
MQRKPFNPFSIKPPAEAADVPRGPMTVSQVTSLVKQAIETAIPATIHVVGEISNFKRHSGGHIYFTLKDSSSELSCVMWRSDGQKLKFTPADGLEVIATGAIEVFERAGRYQLYARKLEPRGVGALELAFRQLCEKLAREGLFDAARKKPLPRYPERMVLVTSPTGAAVADMIRSIERRYPCVHLLIYPVRVQGPGAAEEIARAINTINERADRLGGVDLMIVGRGGGSLEDLWAFNEEIVARAIFSSRIPVISAVGHEVDVTVADLVADVRAATPTAAAELAVPVLEEVVTEVGRLRTRMMRAMRNRLSLASSRLAGAAQRRALREPMIVVRHRAQMVDELASGISRLLMSRVRAHRGRLERVESIVRSIAPHAYLLRCADRLGRSQGRLDRVMGRRSSRAFQAMNAAIERIGRASPDRRVGLLKARLERLSESLPRAVRHRYSLAVERLRAEVQRLEAVGYESVLARGYSVTRLKKARTLVRSIEQVADGTRIVTRIADGEFESQVVNRQQLELFETS